MSAGPTSALVVVAAGVSAALHVGKLPPALPVLQQALSITLLEAGFLLSLVQLAGMTLGLAAGLAADGWGLRRSMIAGLLLLAIASVAGGFAQGAPMLLALRAVEGAGFLLASMPAPSLIRRLVAPAHMSRMLGLWGAYMPFGTAAALLCGPWVMGAAGWPAWWWLLALLSLLAALALWRLVPADPVAPPVAVAPRSGAWSQRLARTLAAPGPWLVALCFAMYSSQWLAVIGFLPSVYRETGVPASWTGVLTALAALVNMAGNIGSGRLLQRGVAPQRLLYTGFATMGLCAAVAFARWPEAAGPAGAAVQYLAVLLFSAVGGLIPGTLFYLAVRLAPDDATVSTTVGWMQQWSSFGQFAGPPLVAWVATRTGGWHWTGAATAACALVGIVLATRVARVLGKVRL